MPKIPREQKALLVDNIQSYLNAEMAEPVGTLASENLLDFMIKQLGPILYNQAVHDARAVLMQQMERLEEELYALEQPVRLTERDGQGKNL